MAYETNRYNSLYGRIFAIVQNESKAQALATHLYNSAVSLDLTNDQLMKYVKTDGFSYDQSVYTSLNSQRTSSSQIGYIGLNVPSMVSKPVDGI